MPMLCGRALCRRPNAAAWAMHDVLGVCPSAGRCLAQHSRDHIPSPFFFSSLDPDNLTPTLLTCFPSPGYLASSCCEQQCIFPTRLVTLEPHSSFSVLSFARCCSAGKAARLFQSRAFATAQRVHDTHTVVASDKQLSTERIHSQTQCPDSQVSAISSQPSGKHLCKLWIVCTLFRQLIGQERRCCRLGAAAGSGSSDPLHPAGEKGPPAHPGPATAARWPAEPSVQPDPALGSAVLPE